jgi:hypothetical protein
MPAQVGVRQAAQFSAPRAIAASTVLAAIARGAPSHTPVQAGVRRITTRGSTPARASHHAANRRMRGPSAPCPQPPSP